MKKTKFTGEIIKGKEIKIILPILFIFIIVYVVFDVINSRKELHELLTSESSNIANSIKIAVNNNNESAIEIENYILEKMQSVSYLTAHLEEHRESRFNFIPELIDEFQLDLILIADSQLNIEATSIINPIIDTNQMLLLVKPIIDNDYVWLETGYMMINNMEFYTIARERLSSDGFILCGISSEKVLQIRRKYGIGSLLKRFANQNDIEYLIVQDTLGIYAAAGEYSIEKRILLNHEIENIIKSKKNSNIIISHNDRKIFELRTPLIFGDNSSILSVGISTENSSSIQMKTTFRAVILILGLVIFYLIMMYLFNLNTKFIKLESENVKFKKHLQIILNNLNDAVIVVNTKNQIEIINSSARELFEIENNSKEINYYDMFPHDDFQINNALNLKQIINYKEIYLRANNERKYLAFSHSLIQNSDNQTELLIIVAKDITEIKKSQELIQRKNRFEAMANLAAGVAHEIRNPLNSISVIVQRFKFEFMPENDKDEYSKLVTIVRNEIARLNEIVTRFLDYAKPKQLRIEKCNPNLIINEITDLFKIKIADNDIVVEKQLYDNCLTIADRDKLKQVLINLVQNAIDSMQNGGKLSIITKDEVERIAIEISDSGIGIPDQMKAKIFDLYFTTKKSGNGIGLAIVQQIVEEHNGSIEVTDNTPNGTIFKIKLPKYYE